MYNWPESPTGMIQALDASHLYLTSGGAVFATLDSGESWSRISPKLDTYLSAVHFVTPGLGWAVGSNGVVIKTEDAGATWTRQRLDANGRWLGAVTFLNQNTGWIGSDGGLVFRTTDGVNWSPITSPTTGFVSRIRFYEPLHGWAVVQRNFVYSDQIAARAYEIWQHEGRPENAEVKNWLAAERELVGQEGLIRTVDGGLHWEIAGELPAAHSVAPVEGNTVFALHLNRLFRSFDGGQIWTKHAIDDHVALSSITFISGSRGWAVGYGRQTGQVLATSDGGDTWSRSSPHMNGIPDIAALNASDVWAIGGNYAATTTVARSRDGGATWDKEYVIPSIGSE